MDNYEKSNKVESFPNKITASTKKLFKTLREADITNTIALKRLADAICDDFKVSKVSIAYSGIQSNTQVNGKLKSKTLGTYTTIRESIRIFQYTAVRKKEVSAKTALDTLLHELCHHFDFKILKLDKSIHSAGFYKRISNLKESLLK